MRDSRRFQLKRKTKCKRKAATLQKIAEELRRIRHSPIDEQGRWLATVLRGHYAYFAVPTNLPAVRALRNLVLMRWLLSLRRRSQRHRLTWSRMNVLAAKYLPPPRVLHPWPEQRFLVNHRGRRRMRNCARTDLRGGRSAMGVPTATVFKGINRGIRHIPDLTLIRRLRCRQGDR